MAGDTVLSPPPLPLVRPGPSIGVFRYDGTRFEPLPNVRCLSIAAPREGADPGSATFRYSFDEFDADPVPSGFARVIPLTASGEGVVLPDDRLVVAMLGPNDQLTYLFDGFALSPEFQVSGRTETVIIQALGVAVRCWDTPIDGSVWRDIATPDDADANTLTELPGRVNPDGKPNATGANYDVNFTGLGKLHPAFLDPDAWISDPTSRRPWTLGMAARMLVVRGNFAQQYVKSPDLSGVDDLLKTLAPTAAGGTVNPDDPSTFTANDVILPDRLLSGAPWPDLLDGLLQPFGFAMTFRLAADANNRPETTLALYRRCDQTAAGLKDLLLQDQDAGLLDPSKTNVAAAQVARDGSMVVNAFDVLTAPDRVEASYVLAPGFSIDAADPNNLDTFKSSNASPTADPDPYRLFVFDESGEGHWDYGSGAWTVGSPTSLDGVLPAGDYAQRRRPGLDDLITTDALGRRRKAELCLLVGYDGDVPGVWDGTGQVYPVKGQWRLDDDVLGIRVTCEDPNAWHVGPFKDVAALRGGVIPLVEWLPDPSKRVHLLLTAAIESDAGLDVTAGRRSASPTRFSITRTIDGRDRYRKETVKAHSRFNTTGTDKVPRDDTDRAGADAEAHRAAHELGPFAGTVSIRRLTTAYRVGDRIRRIAGRDVDLRMSIGAESGESATYPRVVGLSWTFEGGFGTRLQLSDGRGEGA